VWPVTGFRSRWWDAGLAAGLVVFAFVPGVAHQGVDLAELPDRPLDVLGVVLLVAQGLPVAARRRAPGWCLAVVGSAFVANQLLAYPTTFAALGLLVALYSAGAHLRHGRRAVPLVATIVYIGLAIGVHLAGSPEQPADYVAFWLVLTGCWAGGAWVRGAAARDAERRRLADEAVVAAERARIARELHDVVTHHVTAMVVQADAAQYVSDTARVSTLATISDTGRHALTDLRYLLGALRGSHDADHEPAGGLAELVDRTRAAGQPVELVEDGEPAPMADAVRVAAYRVVQESLTNALKHAAGERTVVRVRHHADRLDLEITSDGATRPGLGRGSGRGLVGLRERVGVVGGELTAGARPDGGFTVTASIPREMA